MPVHDWTRVDAGTFHAFHSAWITQLMGALNRGVLPTDYYALAGQVASRRQTDVLTLQRPPATTPSPLVGLAVLEHAPCVRLRAKPAASERRSRVRRGRRLVIRHVTGNRVVAVLKIVSPANKVRRSHDSELAEKVVSLLQADIHALVIDLLAPGRSDPQGIHGAIWSLLDADGYAVPEEEPLTLASYRWDGSEPEAFVEPVAVGRTLIDMPLFLTRERYVNVPLERTYGEAFELLPAHTRQTLEAEVPQA